MVLDESSAGEAVEVASGEAVHVRLTEIRTAGYRWKWVEGENPGVTLEAERFFSPTHPLGGSGHHLWRFRVSASGTVRLKFEYGRPWIAEPLRTVELTLDVHPADHASATSH